MFKAAMNAFKGDGDCPAVPLEPRKDVGNEIAVIACGDFKVYQERFLKLEGVERVILGYTGGGKETPTFNKIHDHTEALLIEFNPKVISYREILSDWRECVDPWAKEKSRQYRAALFWRTLSQQNEALALLDALESKDISKALHVEVERARRFFRARQRYPVLPLEPKNEENEVAILASRGDVTGTLNMYQEIGGVERVVAGLTGGKQENPKDLRPLDHTVALLIEFAPTILSYRQLLELWHECDNPWEEATTPLTRSAIFWRTLPQQDIALQFVEELQAKKPSAKVFVDIERVHKFYEVEIYPDSDTIISPQQRGKESPKFVSRSRPSLEQKLAAGQKPCLSEVSNPIWKTNRK